MQIGIPKESVKNENRVAGSPESIAKLIKLGFTIAVEKNAGAAASFSDKQYQEVGAEVKDRNDVWQSDIIIKVNAPDDDEIALIKDGATLISFISPAQNEELMKKLSSRKINVLAMDAVPRISRAQSMDALSSTANIAGYRAVVEASHQFGRFFTGPGHCSR